MKNCLFEGFILLNMAAGIEIAGGGHHTIRWNRFVHFGRNGVHGIATSDNLVDSNFFSRGGGSVTDTAAVYFGYHSDRNQVSHNRFEGLNGPAISFAAGPTEVNCDNVMDRNLAIDTNHSMSDSGAFYILDRGHRGKGNRITNNIIEQNHSDLDIYLDDQTSNVVVSGNLCLNTKRYSLQIHGGDHNVIRGNLFCLRRGALVGLYQDDAEYGSFGMNGNRFVENVICYSPARPHARWTTINHGSRPLAPLISAGNRAVIRYIRRSIGLRDLPSDASRLARSVHLSPFPANDQGPLPIPVSWP